MFVRLPGVGEVLAALGESAVRLELWSVPATEGGFIRICEIFDSRDGWMVNGSLAAGYQYVKAGLDFDFALGLRSSISGKSAREGSRSS
jgi:hypothetical protein